MQFYSLHQDKRSNQDFKIKIMQMVKTKLTPLKQNTQALKKQQNSFKNKYSFNVPKIKKQHFNLLKKQSQNSQISINQYQNQDQHFISDDSSFLTLPKHKKWQQIWQQTGDKFKKQFFTKRQQKHSKTLTAEQIFYPVDTNSKTKHKSLVIPEMSKTTRNILKKIEIFRKVKNEEIQELKSRKLQKRKITNNQQVFDISQGKENILSKKQQDHEFQRNSQKKCGIKNSQQVRQDEGWEKIKDMEWTSFITGFLLERKVEDLQEERIYREYKARKRENKLGDYIGMFEKKRDFKSLNSSMQNVRKCRFNDIMLESENEMEEQKRRIIECNNPVFKLRRLQSISKSIDTSKSTRSIKIQSSKISNSDVFRTNLSTKKLTFTNR